MSVCGGVSVVDTILDILQNDQEIFINKDGTYCFLMESVVVLIQSSLAVDLGIGSFCHMQSS